MNLVPYGVAHIETRVISMHQQQTYTYHDLDVKSNALARGLRAVGVGKGDRVGVLLGNCIEFATVTLSLVSSA